MGLNSNDLEIIRRLSGIERSLERTRAMEQTVAGFVPGPGAIGNIMISDGTNWTSAPGGGGVLFPPTVRGDMLVGNAALAWVKLPLAGADNSVLTRNATDPEWSGYYINGAAGKTLAFNHSLTFAGGDGMIGTLPITGTFAMGAGTLTVSTTNDVTGANHLHAITASADPGAAAALLKSSAAGHLTLVRLNTDTIADKSGGNLTISPAGDITLNPTGNDVLPSDNYDINLGSLPKKYLTLHCAELWVETLVAQNVMATIGGRILVLPTTVLTMDLSAGVVYIWVKHNEMALGDIGYLEGGTGKIEFIQISGYALIGASAASDYFLIDGDHTAELKDTSLFRVEGTGTLNDGTWTVDHTVLLGGDTYVYTTTDVPSNTFAGGYIVWDALTAAGPFNYFVVTRDYEASGTSHDWYAGDAIANTGTTGDGFIDLYSVHGVNDAVQYGPTIVGNVRTGTAYNAWTEHWAIGNLNGLYGVGVTRYGVALGKYDAASGSYLTIDSVSGIQIFYGSTAIAKWDMSGNVLIGQQTASQNNVYISSGALALRNNTTELISLTAAGIITVGQQAPSQNNVYISSGVISIRNNTTARINMTAAGVLTINDGGGNAVITLDATTGAEITKKLTMPGANSAISIGATPPTNATTGTGIWIDRTGMYGLKANTLEAKFDAVTGAISASAGSLLLDANGLSIKADTTGATTEYHIKFYDSTFTNLLSEIYHYDGMAVKQLTIDATTDIGIISDGLIFLDPTDWVEVQSTLRVESGIYVGALDTAATPGRVSVEANDAGTNTQLCNLLLTHNSSDTPAADFGSYILVRAESSTTEDRNQTEIISLWATATDASRKARTTYNVYDTAMREGMRIEASGSAPLIGFLGAAAVARATHIADATNATDVITRVNAILVVLENLGFVATA